MRPRRRISPVLSSVIERMRSRQLPPWVRNLATGGVVWGVLGLVWGLAIAQDPAWTWGAWVVALVFVLAIAQGGVLFAVMMTLTEGRWGVPIKRMAESFGFFLPVGWLLLLILLVAGRGLYPWNPATFLVEQPIDLEPHSPAAWSTKSLYLTWTFWFLRQTVGLGLLSVLSLLYLKWSLRPDMLHTSRQLYGIDPSWKPPTWWSWFTSAALDLDVEIERSRQRQTLYGVLIALAYPFVFSFLAFDLIMSLSPMWYSNLFGAWFMVSSFWLGLCVVGIGAFVTREWLGITAFVKPRIGVDLGSLCLALSMFWAYTTFSQLLPIWYANMPEEADFVLVRLALPQWSWMASVVAVLCFVTPFFALMSRGLKKMHQPFVLLMLLILIGLFYERTLLVMPSVHFGDEFPIIDFVIVSCGLLAGFIGIFVWVVGTVLSSVPPIPLTDPNMGSHPWDERVRKREP